MAAQHYSDVYRRRFWSICRHFVVWLYLSALELDQIDGDVLQRFLDHDSACTHPRFYARPGVFSGTPSVASQLALFGRFLIDRGAVADWHDPLPNAHGNVHLDAFLDWLRHHRGLREATIGDNERFLRTLLPLRGERSDSWDAAFRSVMLTRGGSVSPSSSGTSPLRCGRTCDSWRRRGCAARGWRERSRRSGASRRRNCLGIPRKRASRR